MQTDYQPTNFSERVERLRVVGGQTWAEIAASLAVSRTMLHYYRNGQHPPDAPVLYRLSEVERRAALPGRDEAAAERLDGRAVEGGQHLRWLRELLRQQQEVVATAQRHEREIEGWIEDAEIELARYPLPPAASHHAAADPQFRDIATVSLPIFGQLPAGWPQTREGVATQRPVREATVPKGRFPEGAFGLDVRGDSMNAAGPHPILDGDTVVLLPPEQRSPQVGDIVAALIDGETCLKRLVRGTGRRRNAGGHHLRSESTNPVHGEIYPVQELVIQGVVVGKL